MKPGSPEYLRERNLETAHALHSLTEEAGQPPTIIEIGERLGYESTNARRRIQALINNGWVERPQHGRSLRLTAKGIREMGKP
jgi:DNA-binding IclR family transcriptional regulator